MMIPMVISRTDTKCQACRGCALALLLTAHLEGNSQARGKESTWGGRDASALRVRPIDLKVQICSS